MRRKDLLSGLGYVLEVHALCFLFAGESNKSRLSPLPPHPSTGTTLHARPTPLIPFLLMLVARASPINPGKSFYNSGGLLCLHSPPPLPSPPSRLLDACSLSPPLQAAQLCIVRSRVEGGRRFIPAGRSKYSQYPCSLFLITLLPSLSRLRYRFYKQPNSKLAVKSVFCLFNGLLAPISTWLNWRTGIFQKTGLVSLT